MCDSLPLPWWATLLLFGVLWPGLSGSTHAEPPPLKAYQLKAVFLLHYGKYIRWPEQAFESPNSPFRICVLGESPFHEALDAAAAGEQVRSRPVEVRYTYLAERTRDCHVLFVSRSEAARLGTMLTLLEREPILTVSDIDHFTDLGGQIAFVVEGSNVRFALHLGRLRALGLEPNANLLRIARVVKRGVE